MEWNSDEVNNKPVKVGGMQHLTTLDSFTILLDMQHGLPYLYNADVSTIAIIDLQDLLWSPSNMNDDSILMDDLCHLLNALPFDGCSVVCDPKCHTSHLDDCLDHREESTEHCIASIIKLGYASCSYALAGIHDNFTVIPDTVPFAVPSLTTDTSIATSTNPTFIATFANASMNHMTVGDYAPMSSMSSTVQVSNETENFCAALTLDMIDISTTDYVTPKIDLDIKCLPFDHGPDQLLTPGKANNPILCQVTEACSFCISDSVFFFAFWIMDLSFVQMFQQMFDKIIARIS